jgi:hypothetical protein
MAKNKVRSDHRRIGAVKGRSEIKNPPTGTRTMRDDKTGKFIDVKPDSKPIKRAGRDRSTEVMERAAERFSDAMKRLAKR